MTDPSNGVPPALLPHIHLVSTHRFPLQAHVSLDVVVEYLLQAPAIVREKASMNWMFLDAPEDGSVMLVWQPLNQLGTQSASDGYVWADAEQAFSSESRGYTVEMYVHRSGFHPPQESIATHSRRRYRLTPARTPNPNLPPCDPSLWIVHYSRAELANNFPANRIPMNQHVQSTLTERRYLQQQGQLVRKEFMLHDRNNWPTINLPGPGFGQQAAGYPGNVISHMNRSHQQTYMQQQQAAGSQAGIGPSPSKRQRQAPPNGPPTSITAGAISQETTVMEDEDTSRGDLMDFLTPKDISTMRYTQHHEWIEEIFSSPYATGQIIPVELGLGRKGELEALTKNFFDAPTTGTPRSTSGGVPVPSRVGKMEAGKAEDFTKRATAKIAEINAEMEKLKRQHARRIAKVKKGVTVREAEHDLRSAGSIENGTEGWKFDPMISSPIGGESANAILAQQGSVDKIVRKVEAELGKSIIVVTELECLQKGGLEEKGSGEDVMNEDYDMADHSADLSRRPSQSTAHLLPGDIHPIGHVNSVGRTPQVSYDGAADTDEPTKNAQDSTNGNVAMMEISQAPEGKEPEGGDWIMVNKESDTTPENEDLSVLNDFTNDSAMDSTAAVTDDVLNTAGDALQSFTPSAGNPPSADFATNNDFTETVDFGNLDTAGEALSGYGEEHGTTMGLDEDANLGLEDSAFGDAFGDAGTGSGEGNGNEMVGS